MRITVNESGGKNVHLHLPNGLVLNRLSARLISVKLKSKNLNISSKQLYTLFREIKTYKKEHSEWKLVEIHSHDGGIVEIVV